LTTFLFYTLAAVILILAFARRNEWQDPAVAFGLLGFFLLNVALGTVGSAPKGKIFAPTMDLYLYRADQYLGLDGPSLARWVFATPLLKLVLLAVYQALPLAFAIVWSAERSRVMVRAVLLAAVAGSVCYRIAPATGPVYAFPGFPWVAPQGSGQVLVDMSMPRNCLPSLHFGWALLLLWNSRGRWLALFASLYLFLMALATVGLGEHYFVDLLASLPFCAAVQAIASSKYLSLQLFDRAKRVSDDLVRDRSS
jgi:hypothetical protein